MEYLIKTCSNPNTVLDNCIGSATTGVGAVSLGKQFVGIEKEDRFFKLARQRITKCKKEVKVMKDGSKSFPSYN